MKSIALRNIPTGVQRAIRARAGQKNISMNQAVVELLQERVRSESRRFITTSTI
jgi:plasmid stability protein